MATSNEVPLAFHIRELKQVAFFTPRTNNERKTTLTAILDFKKELLPPLLPSIMASVLSKSLSK
jgi:hypothetical protein